MQKVEVEQQSLFTPEEMAKLPTLQKALATVGNLYAYCEQQQNDLNESRDFILNHLVQAGLKIQQASHAISEFQTIINGITEVNVNETH